MMMPMLAGGWTTERNATVIDAVDEINLSRYKFNATTPTEIREHLADNTRKIFSRWGVLVGLGIPYRGNYR